MCDAGSARKRVFLWLCVHACACLCGCGCAHARVQVWIRVCERGRGQGAGCGADCVRTMARRRSASCFSFARLLPLSGANIPNCKRLAS